MLECEMEPITRNMGLYYKNPIPSRLKSIVNSGKSVSACALFTGNHRIPSWLLSFHLLYAKKTHCLHCNQHLHLRSTSDYIIMTANQTNGVRI
jgi:hypothetical protein